MQFRGDFVVERLIEAVLGSPPPEFRAQLRRPDDLLVADLVFRNFVLPTDGSPRLERSAPGANAVLIVEYPPQSFAEEAYLETSAVDPAAAGITSEGLPALGAARVRMAGPSRVAYAMPAGITSVPFTAADVLHAMRTWPMALSPAALPDPEPDQWLLSAVVSDAWSSTRAGLAHVLDHTVARGSADAIGAAAQRITERAASALSGSARNVIGRVLVDAMQTELDRLHRTFPALNQGAGHRAGIAALAIAVTEQMAAAGFFVDEATTAVKDIPYLALLLSPHEPAPGQTALEVPYRLIVSPIEDARWSHRDGVMVHEGRTELWHTRLTTAKNDTGPDQPSKVRAIWSPDYPLTRPDLPFRTSLSRSIRRMLVQNMAGFDEVQPNKQVYTPRASSSRRLHLSALGALLDVEGSWSKRPTGVDLAQWRHLASVGRDAYVRVVFAGYLCPYGHAASLVKVTERKFEGAAGQRIAVLRQRYFIVVRERVKDYDSGEHRFAGRNFPFTRVEILTTVTPNLGDPGVGASALAGFDQLATANHVKGFEPRMVFWPMVEATSGGAVDFRFDVAATDITGTRVTFPIPLLFVSEVLNDDKTTIAAIKSAYNAMPQKAQSELGNSTLCFAPFDPNAADEKGDPRLPTASMSFAAGDLRTGLFHTDKPNFYPETRAAAVGIRAVQKMLNRPGAVVDVTYPQVYKDHGFGEADATKNPGKVFLQVVDTPHQLDFGGGTGQAKSDALGALAAPQMSILGLSKLTGPVAATVPPGPITAAAVEGALGHVIDGAFNPADFFKGATILGGIDLASILSEVIGLAGAAVPKLLSRELPDSVETSFHWKTELTTPVPPNVLIPRADGTNASTFLMDSVINTPLRNPAAGTPPGPATFEATASITNFKVNLFGFIILWFDELRFASRTGQKPSVGVHLNDAGAVQFGGPLEFVNELRSLIPSNGFSGGSGIAVTPSGISAGYSLNIPTVGVGIFVLSNASLGASFHLPFDAQPASVRFNFCTREHPFNLTVSAIGGGGFFALGVSAKGVREIEAALEFGACVAINLGVASGLVEIKAGIYFHWLEPADGKGSVELAGYVRLHGELTVIGLISASLTFNLQLAYKKEGGASTVWGEASLEVEVEVLFFSASVSVHCRREFGGSQSDPKFVQLIPDQATWTAYCDAFAEEAA